MAKGKISDHDLLVRIDERVNVISIWTTNHDSHHRRVVAWLATLTIASFVALLTAFIELIFR